MGKRRKKIADKKIVEVYEKKGCNVSATCAALNIDRSTFYLWRNKSEKLDEKLKEVEESLIDFTESKLLEKISEGDMTAIIFHLKTKGKKRGYIERVEQDVTISPFEDLMKSLPDME